MNLAKELVCAEGKVSLDKMRTGVTPGAPDRKKAEIMSETLADVIRERQMNLFVNGTRALLVVLQGMDTAGKDGTIRHVFSRVNPAGCSVTNFKQPSGVEKQHDFLWRAHKAVPPLGIIGIFNRSYYEDVLVVRVHSDELLPEYLRGEKHLWKWRFALINIFEEMLVRNGICVLKLFLHISKDEQKKRLIDRQQTKAKNWKLSGDDITERGYWQQYTEAYEKCIEHTNTKFAPWHIIPSDHKWYRNFAAATLVEDALARMDLPVPKISDPGLLKIKIR
jgi:PPK2 family polyphosphate:nucleotide phosphotransferase